MKSATEASKVRDRPIRNGLLVGLLVLFIGWMCSLIFPQGHDWYMHRLAALSNVPIWLSENAQIAHIYVLTGAILVALLVALVAGLYLLVRVQRNALQELHSESRRGLHFVNLEPNINNTLAFIARCDGAPIHLDDIKRTMHFGNLEAQHAINRLTSLGLVARRYDSHLNMLTGFAFFELTPAGLALAAERGMLQKPRE